MTIPVELADRLKGSTRSQLAAFAAACATRLAPIFESFARTDPGRFQRWLTYLWEVARSPKISPGLELQRQIMSAPEAMVDDSNRPDYYAMRALHVLFYAVDVLLDDDPSKPALACSRAAVSLLRDLDYVIKTTSCSASALADMELRAEHEWVDGFSSAQQDQVDGRGMDDARTAGLYKRVQEVPAEIARSHDWDLSEWQLSR